MIDTVSEKLVLGTGGGAPPTAPSSDTARSLLTADDERTQPGDDGVPTSTDVNTTQHNSTTFCDKKTFSVDWPNIH